ncbi:dolichol kinase [Salinirubellus sp. GCM10025818]|uniref:dolichol kinase n=1 Tax=Salinirubellus TaxID=2162630 RepID=UPI0030CFB704
MGTAHENRLVAPEIERRLVHATGAAIPLGWAVGFLRWREVQLLWTTALLVALALEAGRLSGRVDLAVYDRLTREYEADNVAAYALYMVSTTLVAYLFAFEPGTEVAGVLPYRPGVAASAMLMLALADPVSGLLASGEFRKVKRLRVLAATFAVATLVALPFVPLLPAAFGGVAAAVADGVKPVVAGYVLDDNLTIPPAAAVGMTVGFLL